MSISHRKRKVFKEHRNGRPKIPCKKGVLRNFTKFTWKHLCQSLYFNEVAGLSPATLLIKRLWHRCFPVKFAKFLRTSFLTEHFQWLLLTAPNFVSVPRLCTIQNASNSLTKAQLRTPFLQNSSQWLLSNVRYFFKKGKNRNNFSYLLWAYYAWNLPVATKLKSFSSIILKKLLESIVQFFRSVIKRSTSTTSATSRQTYTTSGQTDTTNRKTSSTSKKTSTTS